MLPHSDLLKLKRWNTPTIYNGWEQITRHDTTKGWFNLDETRDYMPQMGPMVGYAVTVVCEPSNPSHLREHPENLAAYRAYVASVPGPKIVVVQDLDDPHVGSYWGEVIAAAREATGKSMDEVLAALGAAGAAFGRASKEKFGRQGEW